MKQEFLENVIYSYMLNSEGEYSVRKIVFNYLRKKGKYVRKSVLSQYNTF